MAGYSGTPLPRKLGIKSGATVVVINEPANYRKLLGKLPGGALFSNRVSRGAGFIHFFTTRRRDLENRLSTLREQLVQNGVLWVSWPKKSAGAPTDLTEDVIREVAFPLGFVDTKVCAIDETWSGLKLVIRREQRRSKNENASSRSH